MRKTFIFASLLCVLISIPTLAMNGDMGVGTDPNTDGSETYPYLIEDVNDFDTFADPANAATYWAAGVHTQLTTDIDLSGRTYTTAVIAPDLIDDSRYNFTGTPFSGVFDGNFHTFSSLTIYTNTLYRCYLGLFGQVDGIIRNLSVKDSTIAGNNNSVLLGGICGLSYHAGMIENCHFIGEIAGTEALVLRHS